MSGAPELYVVRDLSLDALAILPSRLRGQPRIEALLGAIAAEAQSLEESAYDVLVSTGLDDATGDALDQYGDLVGESRLGLADPDYRRFIRARLLANRARGTRDDLLDVWQIVTAEASAVRLFDHYPAGFTLLTVRSAFMSDSVARRVVRIMTSIKPAGIELALIEALDSPFGYGTGSPFSSGYSVGPLARLLT